MSTFINLLEFGRRGFVVYFTVFEFETEDNYLLHSNQHLLYVHNNTYVPYVH